MKPMHHKKPLMIVTAYLLLIPIFFLDTLTPLEFEAWILYFVPNLLVSLYAETGYAVFFTGLCSGLVVLSSFLSPSELPLIAAIVNRAVGVLSLWIVMVLARLFGRTRVEISELLRAKDELKWEKDLLQTIMNSAGNFHLVYLDRDFNFVRVNETYARTCGYKPEEMIGKNHFALYPHKGNEAIFTRVRDTGTAEEYHDKPFVFPDQPERGTTYWDWTLIPVKDDSGIVKGLVFSLTETTGRKKAEDTANHLASFPRLNSNPILEVDSAGKVVFCNPATESALQRLGKDKEDNRALLPPDLYELLKDLDKKDGASVYREITVHSRIFGEEIHFVSRFGVIRIYVSDITDRKRAQIMLQEAHDRISNVLESIRDGFYAVDRDWNFTYVNRKAAGLWKRNPDELLGKGLWDMAPQIVGTVFDEQYHKAVAEQMPVSFEARSPLTGTWVEVRAYPSGDGLSVYFNDITERKQAEEALRESEAGFARAQEITHLANWKVSVRTNRVWGSSELYRLFNLEPDVSLDAYVEKFHPDDRQRVIESINATIYEGRPYSIDYRILPAPGLLRYVHAEGEVTKDDNGSPIDFFGTVQDITDRKQAEEQINELNKKLEQNIDELKAANKELEAFTYSASHDLRAPLRTIAGFSELLSMKYSDRLKQEGKEYLNWVMKGVAKMDKVIEDLLHLSRISRLDIQKRDMDMSKTTAPIIAELRRNEPGRDVIVDIKEHVMVHADPRLIEIALSNLLGNAWKFTAKKDNARIEFGSFEREGKTVYYVKDNGAGFDQTLTEKLFLPFQRLHSDQEFEGTGIGLAIVERVVRRHGGEIWAEGKPNEGAAFFFTLN